MFAQMDDFVFRPGGTGSEVQISLMRRTAKYQVNTIRFWDNADDICLYQLTTRG
jgi:hypothetical protein